MKCCGRLRRARYCPECGRELFPEGPLGELLDHVEQIAVRFEEQRDLFLADWPKDAVDALPPGDSAWPSRPRVERRLEINRDAAARWRSRADALRALLDRGGR